MSNYTTCPELSATGRDTVMARTVQATRWDSSPGKTSNDCNGFTKGSGPWPGAAPMDSTGKKRPEFIDSQNKLQHDFTKNCGYGFADSAICCRTDYPETDDDILKCCTNVDSLGHGPAQCPQKYCSDTHGMSHDCEQWLITKMGSDPDFALINYERLKTQNRQQLDNTMVQLCVSSHSQKNLQSQACSRYCADPDFNPQGTVSKCAGAIADFCKGKNPGNVDDDLRKICGCYYDDQKIYDNYYSDMSKKLNVPEGILDPQRQCFFPDCGKSLYLQKPLTECKSTILQECTQEVKINNDGTISGNIDIKQDSKCRVITPKDQPNTPSGSTPSGSSPSGSDPNANPTPASDPDSNSSKKDDDKKDDSKKDDDKKDDSKDDDKPFYKTTTGIIVIVTVSVVVLGLLIMVGVYMRSSSSDPEYQPSPYMLPSPMMQRTPIIRPPMMQSSMMQSPMMQRTPITRPPMMMQSSNPMGYR